MTKRCATRRTGFPREVDETQSTQFVGAQIYGLQLCRAESLCLVKFACESDANKLERAFTPDLFGNKAEYKSHKMRARAPMIWCNFTPLVSTPFAQSVATPA